MIIRYDKDTKVVTGKWLSRDVNSELVLKNRPGEALVEIEQDNFNYSIRRAKFDAVSLKVYEDMSLPVEVVKPSVNETLDAIKDTLTNIDARLKKLEGG